MATRIIRRFRDLVDVTFGTPSDGDVVSYDAASDKLVLSATAGGGGATTLLDLTDVTGTDGAGKAPVSDGTDTFTLTDIATQDELDTHAADTTSVHGITDTSVLETITGSQAKADAAETAAEAYTDSSVAALSTVYQPLDSDLSAIAALTTTTFGRALLTLADAAALRTDAGLVIGTDVEAHDADLTAIAGLVPTNDDVLQRKAGAWTNRTIAQLIADLAALGTTFQPLDSDLTSVAALSTTSYGRNLLTLANAAAADWIPNTYLDTDTTLAADSDTKIATQKATKAYVDGNAGGGSTVVDYVEITSPVTVSATSSATANDVVTGGGFTADGTSFYLIEFFSPGPRSSVIDGGIMRVLLQEGSTILGIIGITETPNSSSGTKATVVPFRASRRIQPSAGFHTYKITAYNFAGTSGFVGAGVGGDGSTSLPAYIMVTKLG